MNALLLYALAIGPWESKAKELNAQMNVKKVFPI